MLLASGMRITNIARSVGKRKNELEEELILLNLPEELQQEVIKGRLTKRLGIAIGKLPRHQHMEVYKATLGRTLKAQMNYIYVVEMKNRKIVLFQLTAEERKEVTTAKAQWDKFRKTAYEIMGMIDKHPNLMGEITSDTASVYFMNTLGKSLVHFADSVSKRMKMRELQGGKKNVES